MSAAEELQTNGQQDPAPALADDTPDLVQDKGSNDERDEDEDDADLFGSDNDETVQKQKRALDDQELDSGDDLGRDDRVADTVEDAEEQDQAVGDGGRPTRLIDCDVPRINYPKGDEFYLLNMPNFLGVKQEAFNPETYEPQVLPHDGDPSRQTSAYSTAMSSMFWRRDPHDASKMQSTARFVRWEDGSITLQLATKPTEQYRVNAQPLRQGFGKKVPAATPYDPAKDSLTFLAAAHSTQVVDLQLVHALDASMKILPTGGEQDEAELRLKQLMAATKQEGISLARTKEVEEDPELARKQAEQFEKDRMRAQRKRENAEERLTMKRNNVLGRAGLGGGRGGLSVAGLEDDMGMPLSRGKMKKSKRKMNRHGEIYSDDEDETLPRGRTREDEYDREDDFLADSDEEPEQYGDDDLLDDEEDDPDKDDLEIKGKKTVLEDRPRKERERTPKRSRMDELDEDEDAEGEPDDELLRQSPQQVRKKRRVVEDEDEEE
ncbi:hypothetical protein LTR70_003634 [Exophiala xenobiotica]|uniref:RNA polymerase-associated protein LEO1 n=1 Tax=Lithohypha guttulata TaxID=1690604 RepID=A0ABR0KFN8_9EURO|nr:hypothetical protein LTR24_003175 [Lithohypha guttulata]KAK5322847.1 hypothetical protein LTR70_003634 [Exophiala xenobiotica]